MKVKFRSSSAVNSGVRTNTIIPAPVGIQDKDTLVILTYVEVAATPPAGFVPFTNLNPLNFPVHVGRLFAWWKRAEGEAGDYTVTHANSFTNSVMLVYPGAIQNGSVEDGPPSTNTGNNDATIEANGVRTSVPGSMVIYASAIWQLHPSAPNPPAGGNPIFTERYDPFPVTSAMHVCDGALDPAGETGNKIVNEGPVVDDWVSTLITIKAASAGLRYEGVEIAGTGAPVAISADPLPAWDAVITVTATATITGANGVVMATLAPGVPYQIPGLGHEEWEDEAQIDLSQYSITIAGGQTAYVSFSSRIYEEI